MRGHPSWKGPISGEQGLASQEKGPLYQIAPKITVLV